MSKSRKIFVNIAVQNLEQSKTFFEKLGFEFNPQFTDENAACMIISEEAFVMLLQETYFGTFTKRQISNPKNATEVLLALSCDSREEVDEMVQTALAEGGSRAMEPQDHGFMYGSSFYDPDGHHWEVAWMDMSAVPE